ncbi:MAG: hypothetical protein KBF43_11180 [Dermatophilaceae bacterium]|jgi:hypothetical protein|nr:hypothetical protein [Actinomycetales bacterium]MBP8882353.1 hypothetical protein [Dermatophilaceae bacterium]MBP9919138.1 hypothetical protein [Dermatophilaceae bacterium]
MATITAYPFVRHLRSTATSYVLHTARGELKHGGAGAAFWFRPMPAAISEVPVDDREHQVLVRLRTTDLHEVATPAAVTYRLADPALAAARIDFSIDLRKGTWLGRPLDLVGEAIFGATGAAVTACMSNADLRTLLTIDPAATAGQVAAMLRADERLRSIGVQIVDVRLGLVRPDPDVEKALQTPAREVIQQEADRATFERRAVAVEREAAIGENELANQIELARRREQFIAQEGTNARRKAEEAAAAGAIATDAEARRTLALAQAQAEAERARGAAAADAEKARLTAYDGVSQDVRMALVLQEVAAHLPDIDQLVVTPELVSSLLGRLAGAGAGVGSAAQEVKA